MAHEILWRQLTGLNPEDTAVRAKCQCLRDPDRYVVTMLNVDYVVSLSEKQISSGSPPVPAGFIEQLCLLAYLISAQDLPLANTLVKAEALPSGQFFFRGPHTLPTDKLEKAFGECPENLYQITGQLGAQKSEFGDASIQLYLLPRVPLTIVVWGRCEEFPARASILFDQTAAAHLPLDALHAAVNLAVGEVIRASEESS
jgi:hypothetical protein